MGRTIQYAVLFAVLIATSSAAAQDATIEVVPPPPAAQAPPPYAQPPYAQAPYAQVPAPGMVPQPQVAYGPPTALPSNEPIVRQRRNWALIGAGIGLFVGGWLVTWIATSIWYDQTTECVSSGWWGYTCTHYGPDDTALAWSFAPLVGPWLMLMSEGLTGWDNAFPVLMGSVQVGGFIALMIGVTTTETVVVERPLTSGPRAPRLALRVQPAGLSVELTHF